MGNVKTTNSGHGLIELFEERYDLKDKVKAGGIFALNAHDAMKFAHNKYLLMVDQNTLRFISIARLTGWKREGISPDPKKCCTFWEKSQAHVFCLDDSLPIPFLANDQDMPDANSPKVHKMAKRLEALPMVEMKKIFFDNADDARRTLVEVFGSSSLPHHTVHWHHWQNANTIKNLAFCGLGAYYLTEVRSPYAHGLHAKYEINFAKWFDFPVRCEGDAEIEPAGFLSKGIKKYAAERPEDYGDTEYSKFDNPQLFHHYGVIAYYDEEKNPVGIWWPEQNRLVKPTDVDYPAACFIFRSTLLTVATIQDHLIMVHWIIANAGTVNSAVHLGPLHPIRRLLKPHTYGTAAVNFRSTAILAPVRGLAYRGFAFNAQGFSEMIVHCLQQFKFESLRDHFDASGLPTEDAEKIPFYQDGLAFWQIIEEYVRNYVLIFYPDDASLLGDDELKAYWQGYVDYFAFKSSSPQYAGQSSSSAAHAGDGNDAAIPPPTSIPLGTYNVGLFTRENLIKQLTHHIFWVTGGHQYMGFVVEYLSDHGALPPKVYRNHYETDVQSFFQALSLISLTSGAMPMMVDNWEHIWDHAAFRSKPDQHAAMLHNLRCYQLKLQDLSDTVAHRNQTRAHPFDAFNPKIIECSVSV